MSIKNLEDFFKFILINEYDNICNYFDTRSVKNLYSNVSENKMD